MTERPRAIYPPTRGRTPRRPRTALNLLAVAALAIGIWLVARDGDGQEPPDPAVALMLGDTVVLRVAREKVESASDEELRARLRQIPPGRRETRSRAVVTFETDYAATASTLRRVAREGANTVAVAERAVASSMSLPVVKQRLRNNCETAALSMLLLARGRQGDQMELQRQLPRSGPLDPQTGRDGSLVWGDPSEGYVGRPEGGGTSGGYGVYEKPIAALARRHGLTVTDLSRGPALRVYDAVRSGRPVMVWIGLSEGPVETWQTPAGKSVTGNFGEHTVVLTGIKGDQLAVNDPLSGRRLTWSKPQFEVMWKRLGTRALAV